MARRRARPPSRSGHAGDPPERCGLVVCRGCCCGTPKVPRLDHAAQYAALQRALAGVATVRASGCLDVCEHANVIVVQPSVAGRLAGGRPVWLAMVNDREVEADIVDWVEAGGPGLADPPAVLDLYAFTPSRRVRAGVAE